MKCLFKLFLLLSPLMALGQSAVLERYIEEGLSANRQLEQQRLQTQQQAQSLIEAKGMFMPNASFMASYTRAGGGRTISFPVGDLLNPVYSALNQMSGTEQFPQLENVNEQFLPDNFHETKFRVVQPLYRPEIGYNREAQKYLLEAQQSAFQVSEQELEKEISVAYFNYLKTVEALEIFRINRELLEEILRVNQKLVEQHKATQETVFATEYELQQLAADEANTKKDQQIAQAYFNFLLRKDFTESIEADKAILEKNPAELMQISDYYESAGHRPEYQQLDASLKAHQQLIKTEKAGFLPKVDAVFDAGYQGFGYNFGSQQDFWLGQLSLNWPIFQGFQQKAKLQKARLREEQLIAQRAEVREQLQLQAHQAFFHFQAAQEQFKAHQQAERSARESFRIAQRKYEESMMPFYEWTHYRTRWQNAQLQTNLSKYETFIQQARLQRAAGL